MKYTKKFMVVPYVEENENEINQRKINNDSNDLTKIIQSTDITENDKYRQYNEALKKILFKMTDISKGNLEVKNDKEEEFNELKELNKDIEKNVKKVTKKSKINTEKPTKTTSKDKIAKKTSKKHIDKLFKKFDELDKTSQKIEKKIKQTELNSSLFNYNKKRTQPTNSSTLKKKRLNENQFPNLNMSPIVENSKDKKILNKRFSEKLDPIEQLSNHLNTTYINKTNESLITDDEEEKTRKKSNTTLIKDVNEEKRRKKENRMSVLDQYRGINNEGAPSSSNLINWSHVK